jgi:hypothetical protein
MLLRFSSCAAAEKLGVGLGDDLDLGVRKQRLSKRATRT